jgi:hypothetical protein
METPEPRPDQEGFGEAELGQAQSENPPSDPEMIRAEDDEGAGPAEDLERDPAYNPDDENLERIKGG